MLLAHIEQNGTATCGTAMINRLKIEPSEKQQHSFRRNQNMLMVRYKDKNDIYFLSTIHEASPMRVAKQRRNDISATKSTLVNDYNKSMGGENCNDVLIGNYSSA